MNSHMIYLIFSLTVGIIGLVILFKMYKHITEANEGKAELNETKMVIYSFIEVALIYGNIFTNKAYLTLNWIIRSLNQVIGSLLA
ncbi:hypothetical protein P9X10_02480 [Bacillus cereus]|nr:hypothetical protein [Bacillus cereus]